MKRIQKIIKSFHADYLIYQPGRVGSTSIRDLINLNSRTHVHLHGILFDKIYFLRSPRHLLLLNKLSSLLFWSLLILYKKLVNKKVYVVVPLRDKKTRLDSVKKHFLDRMISQSVLDGSYKELKFKKRSEAIEMIADKYLNKDGLQNWKEVELLNLICAVKYLSRAHSVQRHHTSLVIDSKTIKIVVFNIRIIEKISSELNLHHRVLKVKANRSSDVWYSALFK